MKSGSVFSGTTARGSRLRIGKKAALLALLAELLAGVLTGGALAALQLSGCAIPVRPFIAVWMALCCGLALYGAISPGNIVAWIAMAAALAGSAAADRLNCCTALPWTGLVLAAGGLIAAGCSVPDWLLIFRRARAARIRRRASKGRSLR